MQHVAIDLGSVQSQVCIRNPQGEILQELRVRTAQLPRFLERQTASRVIVETSAEAFFVADAAKAAGHEVRIVPATMVRVLGVGERGIKTDERDALKLSEVSTRIEVPSVHLPSARSRALKKLCNSRQVLVQTRTKLINHVRGYLRGEAVVLPKSEATVLIKRAREKLVQRPEGIPSHIEQVLCCIETLVVQVKQADDELKALSKDDPVCQRLMSVPGVGPVVALRFVAAIDDPSRFRHAHDVMSYMGLTPGENSSSTRKQRTGITKAGAQDLRMALIQGAWSAMRVRHQDPMVQWALQIAARRNRCVAATARARKLAGILFAIWRDNSSYEPLRGAAPQR
jgi:transposase